MQVGWLILVSLAHFRPITCGLLPYDVWWALESVVYQLCKCLITDIWCSRKYPCSPSPPTNSSFVWTPQPLQKFQFSIIQSLKQLWFWNPPPSWNFVNLPWGGYGYFLELHNVTSGLEKSVHCPGQVDFPSGQVTFHSHLLNGQEMKQFICQLVH